MPTRVRSSIATSPKGRIRICVSQEVADAISATGRTRGPVLTIPNGIDVTPVAPAGEVSPAVYGARRRPLTIVGYKRPDLARDLSGRLDAKRREHLLLTEFRERSTFLALLTQSRVAVCLPYEQVGFYLPALEAMASGCIVVTLDCIGNRGFCRHDENCLIAGPDPDPCSARRREPATCLLRNAKACFARLEARPPGTLSTAKGRAFMRSSKTSIGSGARMIGSAEDALAADRAPVWASSAVSPGRGPGPVGRPASHPGPVEGAALPALGGTGLKIALRGGGSAEP